MSVHVSEKRKLKKYGNCGNSDFTEAVLVKLFQRVEEIYYKPPAKLSFKSFWRQYLSHFETAYYKALKPGEENFPES